MAETRRFTAELRDIYTGNYHKYEVEVRLNQVKIEQVFIIDSEGARYTCSIVEPLQK